MKAMHSLTLFVTLVATLAAQKDAPAPKAPAKTALTVVSKDGTKIAWEKTGSGPVIVVVGGALSSRAGAAPLAAALAPTFTVVSYDRRGRGDSGDQKQYAVAREIEDIEALIDANGGAASVFGASSGAVLALEAANELGAKVKDLFVFEPPFVVDDSREPIAHDLFARIAAHVAADRRGDAVALFMTEGVGVPAEAVADMKRAPMWPDMEKLAHTLAYDGALLAGLQSGKPLPVKRWTSVTARTLVIDGGKSPTWMRNAAKALAGVIVGAPRCTIEGHDHSAPSMAPQTLSEVIAAFAKSKPTQR